MSITLEKLPKSIISNIISYLPQQDKINLLYCNYNCYLSVLPYLYKNIYITKSSQLKSSHSFQESNYTLLGVLETHLATEKLNDKIYNLRQQILLESLSVNTQLCEYIENIVIDGFLFDKKQQVDLQDLVSVDLFTLLIKNCPNLKSVDLLNVKVPDNIELPTTMTSLGLTSKTELKYFNDSVKKLKISTDKIGHLDTVDDSFFIKFISNLDELIFENVFGQSEFIEKLTKSSITADKLQLKNLKLIFYHQFEDPTYEILQFLKKIDFGKLDKVELVLGCNDIICNCLHDFLSTLISHNLNIKKLSIIQRTIHRDHNHTEAFDFVIAYFLKKYPNNKNLKYLSIRHMPPVDFNVDHGLEGNYLHRKEIFENMLPSLTGLETFICPTFVQSVACYEQMISNMLWNGCQCNHCEDYLPLYDQYITQHQYYDEIKSHMTDMISPILIGNVARVLSSRIHHSQDINIDKYPLLKHYWDFHTAPYLITHQKKCNFDVSAFPPVTKCVAHFLQEFVDAIGELIPSLRRCILSGVVFDNVGSWECSEA